MQGAAKCINLSFPTEILHCPQCIKAKINSSIMGRRYLKHLILFFFKKISFTPTNVSSKKKKNQKEKKEKKIKTNMVQFHKAP